MRRLHAVWIILLIIAVICALGFWSTCRTTSTMTMQLEQVAQEIKTGDLPQAYAHSRQAEQDWKQGHRVLCMFLGHELLESIDRKFAALPVMISYGEQAQAAMQCVELLGYMDQLRTAEIPRIENIL